MKSNKGFYSVVLLALTFLLWLAPLLWSVDPAEEEEERTQSNLGVTTQQTEGVSNPARLKVILQASSLEWKVLQQLNEQFAAQHSEVEISLQRAEPGLRYSDIAAALHQADTPDILLLRNEWIHSFAVQGLLKPLEFVSSESESAQLDGIMGQLKWNGYTWGIPKHIDPYFLLRPEVPLGSRGEEAPAGSGLSMRSGGEPVYFDVTDPMALITFLLFAGAGLEINENGLQIHKEQMLEWWSDRNGGNPDAVFRLEDYALENRKQAEQAYGVIIPMSAWEQNKGSEMAQWLASESNRWRQGIGMIHGRSYVVSAVSLHSQEALEWIRFMTSRESQKQLYEDAGVWPALLSAYDSAPFLLPGDSESIQSVLEQGTSLPLGRDWHSRLEGLKKVLADWASREGQFSDFVDQLTLWLQPAETPDPDQPVKSPA